MNRSLSSLKAALAACLLVSSSFAQNGAPGPFPAPSEKLKATVENAVAETLREFSAKGVTEKDVAVTVIDLTDVSNPAAGSFRGDVPIYPASVVKMFYMAALHRWEADGKVKIEGEVERGLRDMITVSSNDATGYILDVLTGTSSGAELPEKEFAEWAFRRNAVNRYFSSLGYRNINVNQKTFCEDAYGIEQQFRNYRGENRNMLTTDAAARLMFEIATGRAVSAERSRKMMELMARDWEKPVSDPADREFISHALSPGMKLWSKEGWTSKTRHDAAYIETPDGRKAVIVIFTENFAGEIGIVPGIARRVLDGIRPAK
ncbi:MAG: serine hydrolase [Acidobacteriota bacterium]|nr:MAG: serine hydrolase [Acidobacteriota bacterium]